MEVDSQIQFDNTQVAFSYKSDAELRKANLIFTLVNHPSIASIATGLVKASLALKLPVKGVIKKTVFDHFCGGETIAKCKENIRHLAEYNVGTILDYSVEGAKTEEGFDHTCQEILKTFEAAKGNEHIPFCVFKITGMADAALLEKIQNGDKLQDEEHKAFDRVKQRVDAICAKAYEYQVPVLMDAEESWIQNPVDKLSYEMMRKYNKANAIVFNTFQMYRKDMLTNLKHAFHEAAMHDYFLGVKMVRGAYMEQERARAEDLGYADPICETKEATDDSFNKGLAFCVDQKQRITLMCGSHNEYSNRYLTVLMQKHGMLPNDKRVWFAQLLGMSDNISFNLAKAGYRVVKYVPFGPVASVMPYLFRRAEENTSVAGQSSRELTLIRKELQRRKNHR
ncbi:MAG: proline dehydrogenase family protein [Cyclobacteriaceae bacterium]